MRLKPLRDWSADAIWITFGIVLTLAVTVVAFLWMPPT